jgi:hypothetical protein
MFKILGQSWGYVNDQREEGRLEQFRAELEGILRVRAKLYHPDRNPGSVEADARMRLMNSIAEILSDERRFKIEVDNYLRYYSKAEIQADTQQLSHKVEVADDKLRQFWRELLTPSDDSTLNIGRPRECRLLLQDHVTRLLNYSCTDRERHPPASWVWNLASDASLRKRPVKCAKVSDEVAAKLPDAWRLRHSKKGFVPTGNWQSTGLKAVFAVRNADRPKTLVPVESVLKSLAGREERLDVVDQGFFWEQLRLYIPFMSHLARRDDSIFAVSNMTFERFHNIGALFALSFDLDGCS